MTENNYTLMILDDEELIRESLSDYFEDCGWTVISVGNGKDALELLSKRKPDIVLVDVRLGDMLGIEFIRQANPSCPGVLFFVFTGSPEYELPEDIVRIHEVYPEIIMKPIMDLGLFSDKVVGFLEQIRGTDG